MGVKQREDFDEEKRRKEEEEARRLAALANPIRPKTGQQLRNRYLKKFLLNELCTPIPWFVRFSLLRSFTRAHFEKAIFI